LRSVRSLLKSAVCRPDLQSVIRPAPAVAGYLFLCFASLFSFAQARKESVTCATCHSAEAALQPLTGMGRALGTPDTDPGLRTHPKLTVQKGPFSYTVETREDKSIYSVTDGTRTISVPVRWQFGAGNHTWLLERDGHLYESIVSYYQSIDGLDTTTGDEVLRPKTLEDAFGRELGPTEAKACFGCHATNAVVDGMLNLQSLHPGVSCQHCHIGAGQHLTDIVKGNVASVPPDLSRFTTEDLSTFCGQCHRTWETVVRHHWRGQINVRFQPYRLANSKCFNGADPRISCIACHNPHQSLNRDLASYDSKCLTCHAASTDSSLRPAAAAKPAGAKACPVAKSKCVSCHMPKVPMLGDLLTFTDHEIRIVKPGDQYPN
jgi:Cytochrome c554 and c-prime